MAQKRVCVACKNKGCVAKCRFIQPQDNSLAVPKLYRNPSDFSHWLVWSDNSGWSRFPAKFNGWKERRPAPSTDRHQLRRVPLRHAFNTGLLESLQSDVLDRAA
jgi:hypothetical protein